jgi:energy-coupling factor transporter ATP-binding protein EcfA2
MSLAENIYLNRLDEFTRFGFLMRGSLEREAAALMRRFDVRARGPAALFSSLSGGNQQKAVLAREITLPNLSCLVAAQPTRGLDVGAVAAVYGHIRSACSRGIAVLLVSSELDELLTVADRIVVLYRGLIMGSCAADPARTDWRHDGGAAAMTTLKQDSPLPARARVSLRPALLVPVAAVAFAAAVGLLLIAVIGVSVPNAIATFVDGTVGSAYALAASLNRSAVFALVGFGFVLANRANLTNVGGEGQIAVGGIAATAVALYGHVSGLPLGLSFILPTLAAVIAGSLWGAFAAVLKVKSGTNEVISTLLLSFVGVWLLYWSVQSTALLRKPMTSSATLPESLEIPDETKLPLLTGDYAFPVHVGLPLTLILAIVVGVILSKTILGFRAAQLS